MTGGGEDRRGPRCITIQRSSAGFGFTLRHFIVYPPDSVSVSDVAVLDFVRFSFGKNEEKERNDEEKQGTKKQNKTKQNKQVSSNCVRREMGFGFFFASFEAKLHSQSSLFRERETTPARKRKKERERRNAHVTIYPLLQLGGSCIVKGPDREKASWRKLLRLASERDREREKETLIGRRPFKAAEASPDLASADRMTRQVRIGGTSKRDGRSLSLSLSLYILCSLAQTRAPLVAAARAIYN